jgi:hypothetical protein
MCQVLSAGAVLVRNLAKAKPQQPAALRETHLPKTLDEYFLPPTVCCVVGRDVRVNMCPGWGRDTGRRLHLWLRCGDFIQRHDAVTLLKQKAHGVSPLWRNLLHLWHRVRQLVVKHLLLVQWLDYSSPCCLTAFCLHMKLLLFTTNLKKNIVKIICPI